VWKNAHTFEISEHVHEMQQRQKSKARAVGGILVTYK
jgi:hypothetical protein